MEEGGVGVLVEGMGEGGVGVLMEGIGEGGKELRDAIEEFGDYPPESDQPRKKWKVFAPVSLCTFWFCTFVPDVQEKNVNKDMRQVKIFKQQQLQLCSALRGNDRRIGRMVPEHVERSFLDPEYNFFAVRRILRPRFAKQKFAQLRTI